MTTAAPAILAICFILLAGTIAAGCSERSSPATQRKIDSLRILKNIVDSPGAEKARCKEDQENNCNDNSRTRPPAESFENIDVMPPMAEPVYQPVCIIDKNHPDFGDFSPEACPELVGKMTKQKGLPPEPGPAGKKTISGIDSNHNGIRDDVERYLEIVYDDPELKPVLDILKATARTDQLLLENWENKDMVLKISAENEIQGWCRVKLMRVYMGNNYHHADDFVESIKFNTYERLKAWNRINSYYNGMVFSMPDDATISEKCGIPLEKIEQVYQEEDGILEEYQFNND